VGDLGGLQVAYGAKKFAGVVAAGLRKTIF